RHTVARELPPHHRRPPQIRAKDRRPALEALRRNADHGERHPIQRDRLTHDRSGTAESTMPETIADDDDGTRSRRTIFIRLKKPAGPGPKTEHVEVIARHQLSEDPFGRVAHREAEWHRE